MSLAETATKMISDFTYRRISKCWGCRQKKEKQDKGSIRIHYILRFHRILNKVNGNECSLCNVSHRFTASYRAARCVPYRTESPCRIASHRIVSYALYSIVQYIGVIIVPYRCDSLPYCRNSIYGMTRNGKHVITT